MAVKITTHQTSGHCLRSGNFDGGLLAEKLQVQLSGGSTGITNVGSLHVQLVTSKASLCKPSRDPTWPKDW